MTQVSSVYTRLIALTREGVVFRLSFDYRADLVEKMGLLPHASFDPETRSWTCQVSTQALTVLRLWHQEGLVDSSPDSLVYPDEQILPVAPATLRPGTLRRPYLVTPAFRDDRLYARFRAIPGATWVRASHAISYPPQAATALSELVDKAILSDPEKLLSPADVSLSFDARSGLFVVRGDPRAQVAFDKHFPARDIVSAWRDKNFDVAFTDDFSEEVYRGELARARAPREISGLKATLWPYQAQSISVALERSGFGVFHDMGLGKTLIAIATGHELTFNRAETTRSVIVVPGSVRTQWKNEIERFSTGEVVVIDGDLKRRRDLYRAAAAAAAPWLIVNYDVLSRDYALLAPLVNGALLVADEAHRLKSPTAKRTKAMRQLAARAPRRLALTGTPIQNDPGEWYSVISGFVAPGCFGSPKDFLNRYAYPGRFGGYEGARNLGELRTRSSTYYIRYTKAEVASHLPPLRVQHRPLDVDPAYKQALARAHREARDEIKSAALDRAQATGRVGHILDGSDIEDVTAGAEMTAISMLRLLCSSPRIVEASDSPSAQALVDAGLLPDSDGPKLDELRSMAAELQAEGQRVVIFTFSKRMANLIAQRFATDGIRHVLFTGDTSSKDRDTAVRAFTTSSTDLVPGPTAFIATDAGGEGLNLGAQCSLLINVDIPWTPGVLAQRSARIHRIDGTADKYLVINFTLRGTIEEGILRMIERKADLQDAIFGELGGRSRSTGRPGRSVFEEALSSWDEKEL